MYAGCRGGVLDRADLTVDVAFQGDGGEAVGRVGFEAGDLDDARCAYGLAFGDDRRCRRHGFGRLGADVAAFVRILECEREFQGVECGVADGERDAWVRISPPLFLSSHELSRPEHSTNSAVPHDRKDLIIVVKLWKLVG